MSVDMHVGGGSDKWLEIGLRYNKGLLLPLKRPSIS